MLTSRTIGHGCMTVNERGFTSGKCLLLLPIMSNPSVLLNSFYSNIIRNVQLLSAVNEEIIIINLSDFFASIFTLLIIPPIIF